ncbi:MAG: hypothetical protein RLZZ568_648 [Cyanobacteriota bacterium]|jgi:ribosome-binding protein aMBF1 (putative translation factor)
MLSVGLKAIFLTTYWRVEIMNNRKRVLSQAAIAHKETLRKNLQHRLERARASGDNSLVSQLEAEAAYLHL